MKKIFKKLVMNLNLLVFLPGYIVFILVMALPEKEPLSPTLDEVFVSMIDQPLQTVKALWKTIITIQ